MTWYILSQNIIVLRKEEEDLNLSMLSQKFSFSYYQKIVIPGLLMVFAFGRVDVPHDQFWVDLLGFHMRQLFVLTLMHLLIVKLNATAN